MRNRGLVLSLAILVSALCVYYLSFTFAGRNQDAKAVKFATDANGKLDYSKKQAYLDSVWNKPVFNFLGAEYTYKEIKEKELSLGLDLQGGMHIVLEVSPVDILVALAGNSQDKNFREALKKATEAQKNSQDPYIEIFFREYEALAGKDKLAIPFVNSANRSHIDFKSNDQDIKTFIRDEVEKSIDRAFEIIRSRIDRFGVNQPNVQRIQGTGRIQVELPGVNNPERVRKLLQGVAKLEFWEVWDIKEAIPHIMAVNEYWVKKKQAAQTVNLTIPSQDTTQTASADTTKKSGSDDLFVENKNNEAKTDSTTDKKDDIAKADSSANQQMQASELLTKRISLRSGADLIYDVIDTASINRILNDVNVRAVLPKDMRFGWSVKPIVEADGKSLFELYTLRKNRGENALLTGEVIADASSGFDDRGRPDVAMKMTTEGAKKWKKITSENIGKQIAITLDGQVYSAPVVQSEIPNGNSSISGNFTVEEAQDLANILKVGKLPAPTRIVEEAVIGPSLGVEAQSQGLISIAAGFALVVLFTVAYYAKSGFVAVVALFANVFFILGVLANLNTALTLPGIAGIALTIGMAVDANVLIFERIREEMRFGKTLMEAIDLGYDRAFITIVDSNLTSLMTAVILYVFGLGPIQGFAITLIIGISCSFFTAVFITRVIMSFMTNKGNESNISFEMPYSKNVLLNINYDFMGKRKIAYTVSSVLILVGLALMFVKPLNLGVDFKGGRSYVVAFQGNVVPSEIKVELLKSLGSADVKSYNGEDKVKITTAFMIEDESQEADKKVLETMTAGLQKYDNLKPEVISSSKVGATIADDIKSASGIAVLFSLIAIFLYVFFRFKNWQFGFGAVVALFHDTLFIFAGYSYANMLGFSFEIDQVFIAAVLTVIGYSINDTVVVFDFIREKLYEYQGKSLAEAMNLSINQTLSRTTITALTTVLVVITLLIAGGEVLRGFSFALFVGIGVGTYSSIFIATALVLDTMKTLPEVQAVRIRTTEQFDSEETKS